MLAAKIRFREYDILAEKAEKYFGKNSIEAIFLKQRASKSLREMATLYNVHYPKAYGMWTEYKTKVETYEKCIEDTERRERRMRK